MLHRKIPSFLLALTLISAAGVAHAGDAELKAANELVRLVTTEKSYKDMISQMTMGMLQSLSAQGQQVPPDTGEKLQKALLEVMPYEEVMKWSAEIYAARFSTGELRELIRFYKTPVGLKMAKLLPEIMGEVGKKTAAIMPERLPAAMKRAGLQP